MECVVLNATDVTMGNDTLLQQHCFKIRFRTFGPSDECYNKLCSIIYSNSNNYDEGLLCKMFFSIIKYIQININVKSKMKPVYANIQCDAVRLLLMPPMCDVRSDSLHVS